MSEEAMIASRAESHTISDSVSSIPTSLQYAAADEVVAL